MEPYCFVLAVQVCTTLPPPVQIQIEFSGSVIDSSGNSFGLGYFYVYDNSLSQAENFANIKAGIVEQAASEGGVKLLTNNVNILMAVN